MAPGPNTFGPAWLALQLAALIPGYPNTPLCVALSGGVDSTALLAALAGIHPRPPNLRALHVDHGLRPASRDWAQHCRALARRLRVPLQVLTTQVARPAGASLEAAARDARYALLAAALKPGEALLLAHHADDQLETVLLQLLRGSGLPGLSAMPAATPFAPGISVRPLLSRARAELQAWVQGQGLTWIEDDSNADETLNRNYLRRQILPLIQARWPSAAAAVARSARHLAEAQSLLDRLARTDVERASYGESLSVKTLRAFPPDRLNNAVRFWIARAGLLVPDTRRLAEICGPLLKAREDANPYVEWGEEGARVQREGDLLTLSRQRPQASPRTPTADAHSASVTHAASGAHSAVPPDFVWSWRNAPQFDLPHLLGKLQLEPDPHGPIDLDALPHPLIVRWRRGGERLTPRRGGPRRALKSLLQESRVPASERQELPLLFASASAASTTSTADGEKLLAVAHLLLDETVQATSATRHRARLQWVKSPH
jgi:tRNA(Ile)-lysidine synthase